MHKQPFVFVPGGRVFIKMVIRYRGFSLGSWSLTALQHTTSTSHIASDPTTTEENKIWGWTNSCRISGSFIQIAHFPCSFPSLSPPPLDPRGRHHSVRERETNKHSGKHGRVVTAEKGEWGREAETAVLGLIMRAKLWMSGSLLSLTDTRWQRFAAQLLTLVSLYVYLLLTPCCLIIEPLGLFVYVWLRVSGWAEGWWW